MSDGARDIGTCHIATWILRCAKCQGIQQVVRARCFVVANCGLRFARSCCHVLLGDPVKFSHSEQICT